MTRDDDIAARPATGPPPHAARLLGMRPAAALFAADLLAMSVSMAAALNLRFAGEVPAFHAVPYGAALPLLLAIRLVFARLFGLYDLRHRLTPAEHAFGGMGAAALGAAAGYLALALLILYGPDYQLSRAVAVLDALFLWAWFVVSRAGMLRLLRRRGCRIRLMVTGPPADTRPLAAEVRAHAPALMTVASETALETAPGALEADRYDAVLVAGAGMSEATLARVLAVCDRRGIDVLLHPELDAMLVAGGEMNSLGGVPVVALAPALDRTAYGFTKRLLDIAVSVTLGLLLLPFLLGLGALVRLTSRGPALFVQERVGVRGQPFRMLKFRTMVQGAEAASGPVLSGPDDPRVTALGRLMRRTRLDEAPQLWNVATGAMSLVGPRPERPEFVARYEEANPFYARRHLVRPGLTGLAQVHGRYDSDYAHKLRYDLMYVNSASFGMDLRLLFATVRIVITGAGAQ